MKTSLEYIDSAADHAVTTREKQPSSLSEILRRMQDSPTVSSALRSALRKALQENG